MDLRFLLESRALNPTERQRCYEYFHRWKTLLDAVESGSIPAEHMGWGHAGAELVLVVPTGMTREQRQFVYRIADSLRERYRAAIYFVYDRPEMEVELSLLPPSAQVYRIDLEVLSQMMGGNQELKKEVWKDLLQLLKAARMPQTKSRGDDKPREVHGGSLIHYWFI